MPKAVQLGRIDKRSLSEAVTGYFVGDDDGVHDSQNTFFGLLLNRDDDTKSNHLSLIVPRREYKRGNRVRINLEGEDKIVEFGLPLMKQRDWVRASLTL